MTNQHEAARQAAEALAAQADRFMRAAQVLTRMVMRLSALDDPVKLVTSIAKYQHSALPEPDFVSDVAAMLEGAKSPEWREARAKQRQAAVRHKLEWQLSSAEQPVTDLPDWGRSMVLRIAREKCDILSAAVAAIERGRDGDGEILHHLTNYMAGRYGVFSLRHALEKAGMAPGQSNVIRLSAYRGDGSAA
jgi:hypothetical protein